MALDFGKWLAAAEPGDSIVYFSGRLAEERAKHGFGRTAGLRAAMDAWKAALAGRVGLTQRLRADGKGCDYIATAGRFSPPLSHYRNAIDRDLKLAALHA